MLACDENFIRRQASHKRPYGPRDHWWDANMKLAYETISGQQNALWFNTQWKEVTDLVGDEFFGMKC